MTSFIHPLPPTHLPSHSSTLPLIYHLLSYSSSTHSLLFIYPPTHLSYFLLIIHPLPSIHLPSHSFIIFPTHHPPTPFYSSTLPLIYHLLSYSSSTHSLLFIYPPTHLSSTFLLIIHPLPSIHLPSHSFIIIIIIII